ncbi:tail-specific protease [Lysobacter pythonis]|uniref:Tail-specific protease n=2 Tax=Solilutibacter pythonis TaxID=2483112 RepID=A0A3M2HWL3_9GAMM|nr:tail-specific protease [Lysobacter pythonis]
MADGALPPRTAPERPALPAEAVPPVAPPARRPASGNAARKPAASAFVTTRAQTDTAAVVHGLLSSSRFAYRPRELDAALGAEVWKRYLESLDPSKVYLTRADIDGFGAGDRLMVEAITGGDFNPTYAVFQRYRERVKARSEYARALLKQDIFDFTGEDRYEYDRKDVPWASDAAALDALWRQSVRYDWLRLKLAGKSPEDIRKTLDKRYANVAKGIDDLNAEDIFQTALNAYTGSIDPHTNYFNPRAAENFNQQMSLSLQGIGAQLQKREDIVTIMELIPGGPAARDARLKPGDRIVAVGQGAQGAMEDVVGWRIDDVVAKIRGDKGSVVRLDILPASAPVDGKPVRIQLTRDKVVLADSQAKPEIIQLPEAAGQPPRRVGVVKLPSFYQDFSARRARDVEGASASRDVARILADFRKEKLDGVVLDLRNNGGGSLDEAVAITGLFIDQGPVVQERQAGGRIGVRADREPGMAWDGPLAVLINRASASASEIVAGAIQDYGRGLIIGETSFGKGTVQAMVGLDRIVQNQGAAQYGDVKLTVAQFFRPSGGSTQNKGVSPDIPFPVTVDASEYGENTFDNALPWTKIAASPHVTYGQFAGLLPVLTRLHETRAAKDVEYQWRVEDAAEFRAQREKKWISLNVDERRAERDKQETKRKFRQAERKRLGLPLDPLADDGMDDGLNRLERDVAREAERDKLAEKLPDPFLREAAAILGDAARLLDGDRALAAKVLPQSTAPGRWAD